MERVVGLGAGGHAKVMLEALRLMGGYEPVGLLDPDPQRQGASVLGVPVLGDDNLLGQLTADGIRCAFIGLGSTSSTRPRQRLYERARRHGLRVIRIVHPQSILAPSVQLGDGVAIMAGAIINAEASLQDNIIVNTGALIEHDCVIGQHVHIATGARLAGGVRVGDGAHIGIGAAVLQGRHIGQRAVVGAGAVVVHHVPDETVVVGIPARLLRKASAS